MMTTLDNGAAHIVTTFDFDDAITMSGTEFDARYFGADDDTTDVFALEADGNAFAVTDYRTGKTTLVTVID